MLVEPGQSIIIQNGMAYEVNVSLQAALPVTELKSLLTTTPTIELPVLPRNTKYLHFDPARNYGVVMVERPPKRQRMKISGTNYDLQLPFQYFVYIFYADDNAYRMVGIRQSFLFWRNAPYRTREDRLFRARIPNVGNSGDICWGNTVNGTDRLTFAEHIDRLTDSFNVTEFNGDLGWNTPGYNESFTDWQNASVDPNVFMGWDMFNASGHTIEEVFEGYFTFEPTDITLLNSYVDMPTMPVNFTVGRATGWLNSLTEGQRARILVATRNMEQPTTFPPDSMPTEDDDATATPEAN